MIRSGKESIGYSNRPDYTLTSGTGKRVYDVYVAFKVPFSVTPEVTTAISSLDISNSHNARVTCSANNITPYGFSIRIETWGDSIVYDVGVEWIAYVN